MGYSIYVHDIVQYQAQCAEIGCMATFPPRSVRRLAEDDRDDHRRFHEAEWQRQNEEWENANAV